MRITRERPLTGSSILTGAGSSGSPVSANGLPYAALFVAVFAISTSAILIRWSESGPLTIAFNRMTFTTLMLTPFALMRWKELKALPLRVWKAVVVIGLILAAHFALFITAVTETSVAASVLLATIHPLFIGPVSHFVFRERLSRFNSLGIVIAFSGILILIGGDLMESGGSNFYGNMMGLLAGVCAGLYYLGGRILRTGKFGIMRHDRDGSSGSREGGSGLSIQLYAWLVYGFCSIFLFFTCLLTKSSLTAEVTEDYYLFVAMALGPSLMGHTLQNWSLRHLPAYIVSVSLLFEPVGSSILAALLLDELPQAAPYIGGAIILAGILMTMKRKGTGHAKDY